MAEASECVLVENARGRTSSAAECLLRAESPEDLRKKLHEIDIRVPRRGCGRTKEHTQRFSLIELLSCSDIGRFFCFPLEVWEQDKPDFVLEMNGENIGVEQTEAVSQNEAQKNVLRNRSSHFQVLYYFAERHRAGETKNLGGAEKIARTCELDPHNEESLGWAGNECERDWAEV